MYRHLPGGFRLGLLLPRKLHRVELMAQGESALSELSLMGSLMTTLCRFPAYSIMVDRSSVVS